MKNGLTNHSDVTRGDLAAFYFHQGSNSRAYDYLGAHPAENGFVFRVWAPNAEYIAVCGDFNGWDRGAHPMKRVTDVGVWEVTATNAKVGDKYKYYIYLI